MNAEPSSRRRATIKEIERLRVSAIIRTTDRELAADAMAAAVEGGFRMVEFTLTTPGALELITRFAANDELLVGTGTVLTTQQAVDAVSAGARFVVSPICDSEVVARARGLGAVTIPGTFTPTEMVAADRCGADFLKLFPAVPGGPAYVTAVLGPLPHLRLFPTAGVTVDNFVDFLDAGCASVGFVRPLFDRRDMAAGDMDAIQRRAARIIERLVLRDASFDGAK